MRAKAIALITAISVCAGLLGGCAQKPEKSADFSGIGTVCELATLQCYYHNVAESRVEASGLFGGWLKTGYKKLWIEYSGIVEVGVDIGEVAISNPNPEGIVQVHVPEAKVLNVSLDAGSISDPLTETGFLTSISAEEKTAAIAAAQDNMQETAEQNQTMLRQAKERARQTIEGYVKNVGATIGQDYTVEWI